MSTGISISSINRIKELADEKRFAEALEILDTQNLDKSINPQFLRISGEIFRENKRYYDSRKYLDEITLPQDADANGAYNIARKALWIIEKLKESPDEELNKVKLAITQREWLEYAQINI